MQEACADARPSSLTASPLSSRSLKDSISLKVGSDFDDHMQAADFPVSALLLSSSVWASVYKTLSPGCP